jgi:hypothetical protein
MKLKSLPTGEYKSTLTRAILLTLLPPEPIFSYFVTKPTSNSANNETREIEKKDFFVSIEFLSWPIIRYKTEVLFGFVDLLVSFGGIAGLFLGFSLLSGIEIIYYFSMRACCMFVKNRVSFL